MRISTNLMKLHLSLGFRGAIDAFCEAGFGGIDFKFDEKELYDGTLDEDFFVKTKDYAHKKGIPIVQAHAPYPSSYSEEDKTEKRFSDIVKSMKNAALLGATMIVIHPCKHIDCNDAEGYRLMMDYNLRFYRKLLPYAKEYGIKIAIENIRRSVTAQAEGLAALFDLLCDESFVVCYDIGHANLTGQDTAEMIRKLGERIGCTHIHDNDGKDKDTHTLPFYGNIDWEGAMRAFAEIGYSGDISYEGGGFLSKVPSEVKPQGLKYMSAVGKYLIDRIKFYADSVGRV